MIHEIIEQDRILNIKLLKQENMDLLLHFYQVDKTFYNKKTKTIEKSYKWIDEDAKKFFELNSEKIMLWSLNKEQIRIIRNKNYKEAL
jgi:hypothetical protein